MPKLKAKPVLKFTALEKAIESSLGTLQDVCGGGADAVSLRSKEKQKLQAEKQRLSKKKATLLKRKRATAVKLQKAPNAETRKLLKTVEKELADVSKNLDKTNAENAKVAEELAGLKLHMKRLTAYLKGVNAADKSLNKSVKRRKTRKRTTTAKLAA